MSALFLPYKSKCIIVQQSREVTSRSALSEFTSLPLSRPQRARFPCTPVAGAHSAFTYRSANRRGDVGDLCYFEAAEAV